MAKLKTAPVSNTMYRHFAVMTLAVTLLVGVFASGENRQAVAQAIEEQSDAAERAEFKDHKFGAPKLVQSEQLQARVYNSDSDYRDTYSSDYGTPMDRIASRADARGGSGAGAATRGGKGYVPASYASHQLSEEELAKLTPAQREALLAQIANGGQSLDQAQRQQQIDTLVSASARRAGSENGIE